MNLDNKLRALFDALTHNKPDPAPRRASASRTHATKVPAARRKAINRRRNRQRRATRQAQRRAK